MSSPEPMSTDLVYATAPLSERKKYAEALADAGELVPSGFRNKNGTPNPGKLLLAFETGAMLGIHPLAALNGIHVIEGKPTISAGLMSALVRNKGHKLRVRSTGSIDDNTFTVTATLIRADDPSAPFEAVWTIERARRAELFGKGNWRKYPEAMLKARAISEVCREGAEDALMGVAYVPEELGAEVNEAGDVIEGEIIEDEPTPAPAPKTRQTAPQAAPGALQDEDRHAIADEFANRARRALTVTDARTLYREAVHRGILDYPLTSGELLEDVLRARGEQLADEEAHAAAEEMPPALDGNEDDA